MKALIWDVETTDLELAIRTYQLKNYTRYFNPDTIKRDWSMLGASWMWLDDEHASAISVSPKAPLDDRELIKTLHNKLSEADILIGHNSDNFDLKKFNTRAIYYDLPPLAPKQQIDTLKMARKYFKFTSNKLSYICSYLGLELKDKAPEWEDVINGCPESLRCMREYNKQDVIATKDLYLKLRSYHHTHQKISDNPRDVAGESVVVCKKCASPSLQRRGSYRLASGRKRQQFNCNDCGGWQSGEFVNSL